MIQLDTIYNIDCLAGMKDIPDQSVDAVICDLPYGTTRNSWDSVIPMDELWAEYRRVAKETAAIVLFGQQPFTSMLVASNPDMFRYEWIWRKEQATGHLNANRAPLKIHENILVFYRTQPTYNPQFTEGTPYTARRTSLRSTNYGRQRGTTTVSDGRRYPVDIIDCDRDTDGFHPTQKPVDLLRYLVRTYTDKGGVILDNCIGSGTTAVACIREGRHFVGFETNQEYYEHACRRIRAEQAQLTLFDI